MTTCAIRFEPRLIRSARAAPSLKCLRTTPLSTQNAFDRTHRTLRFHSQVETRFELFTRDTGFAYPFARLTPRQRVNAASAPIVLGRSLPNLSAPSSRDQRYVRSIYATHISKTSTRCLAW